jgi:hypothetical protein
MVNDLAISMRPIVALLVMVWRAGFYHIEKTPLEFEELLRSGIETKPFKEAF